MLLSLVGDVIWFGGKILREEWVEGNDLGDVGDIRKLRNSLFLKLLQLGQNATTHLYL